MAVLQELERKQDDVERLEIENKLLQCMTEKMLVGTV